MRWRPPSPAATCCSTGPAPICSRRRFRRLRSTGRRDRGASRPASGSRATAAGLQPVVVETQPFPGFPTDLQAQFMALMCTANGTSQIRETIFENRFMHVQELARLGAEIDLKGDTALVTGVERLARRAGHGDGSARLGVAGHRRARREGETMIDRVYHLDRGFERMEESSADAAPRSSAYRAEARPKLTVSCHAVAC